MSLPHLGFIGLGSMGGPMAQNLVQAGYTLTVFDLDSQKVKALSGAQVATTIESLVKESDIVLTSVPSFEIAVTVAEELLAFARANQIFIELSTITPSQAIELAKAYAVNGAVRLDVPVSGGAVGAQKGNLRMFVGGDKDTVAQCQPLFEVLGDPDRIVYCGEAGSGQMVKIVNQVTMGLSNAIYLETIGYGAKMGIDIDAMTQAIGGNEPWRQQFERIAQRIKDGNATHTDIKFVQLQQFSDDAMAQGYMMPLARALFEFCDKGERISQEEIYPAPSFWHELMKKYDSE